MVETSQESGTIKWNGKTVSDHAHLCIFYVNGLSDLVSEPFSSSLNFISFALLLHVTEFHDDRS